MIHSILLLAFLMLCISGEAGAQDKNKVLWKFSEMVCDDAPRDDGLEPTGDYGDLEVLLFEGNEKIGVEYTVCEGGCRSRIAADVTFDPNSGRLIFFEKESSLHFVGKIKGDFLEGKMNDPDWGPDAFELKLPRRLMRPTKR